MKSNSDNLLRQQKWQNWCSDF